MNVAAFAQAPATAASAPSRSSAERATELAAKGRCEEALPLLKKLTPRVADKELKYKSLMATVRCAMSQKEEQTVADTLFELNRDFPEDPEALYITSQFFLTLAERASQQLATTAPNSYQTRELHADSLENQNKWEDAAAIYRKILEEQPRLRGIHFRLGHIALSKPESPASSEDAKNEFEQELAIDPANAAAQFWLGEIARRAGQSDHAISHFTAASKLSPQFADPWLALGLTLNSVQRFSEAIPALEHYVKMSPRDPTGHYQLSIAYARTGRQDDFLREKSLTQQLSEKNQTRTPQADVAPQ